MKKECDIGIPVLSVTGEGLAEAWEKSLVELYNQGIDLGTQYDKEGDRLSRDATMSITVRKPFSEPRVHKCFPGGIEDLEEYRLEVLDGIKKTWIKEPTNPRDSKWEYTYYGRSFQREAPLTLAMAYLDGLPEELIKELGKNGARVLLKMPWAKVEEREVKRYGLDSEGKLKAIDRGLEKVVVIDQVEACIDLLARDPRTRRAQIVTWKPEEDLVSYDPPCLQSIWFRIVKGEDGRNRLCMNVRMRSNDAYDAAFMNMYVFSFIQQHVAEGVSKRIGEPIELGRYFHEADSYHIYGRRLDHFENMFLQHLKTRTFEERTLPQSLVEEISAEARPRILERVARKNAEYDSERRE
jgi:thymidylate synthase